jgi:hypothetical protein
MDACSAKTMQTARKAVDVTIPSLFFSGILGRYVESGKGNIVLENMAELLLVNQALDFVVLP